MTSVPQRVFVICNHCGDGFDLNVRQVYEHRRQALPHLCRTCRGSGRPTRAEIAQAKRWWLQRFELAELRSWPPL